ncbi:hypothetical protein D9619_000888 [Psilocybe cf. subviscida]|uniref:Uncharacterized protein n=1 Tax=Psilocybe cf. subviscida TaxID=2480587 RepID=A0A8H5BGN5_9AGAR|nr:hypothetical protein D9619_000888 [Psilocybe cf. subviscida]
MTSTPPPGSPFASRNTNTPLGNPRTPFSSSRNPFVGSVAEDSPTSTLTESVSITPGALRNAPSQHFQTNGSTQAPGRPVQIRADPALMTCFDPADRELYDLWAPRR